MKRSSQLLRRVVLVGMIVVLMAGLGAVVKTATAAGTPAATSQAVVETYFNDVLGKADAGAAAAVLAPGFRRTDRSQSGVTLGAPGVMFLANYERQAFPDLRYTIDDLVVEGDHVAVCWTAQGTQAGAYGTAAATGKPVVWTGMSFFQLQDGKIAGEEANLETPSAVLLTKDLRISPSYMQ